VLDGVGLVSGVVADGTDVDVQGGAHHPPRRVLQHVGRVHSLGLVVVLAEDTVGRQFLGFLDLLLRLELERWGNIFESAGQRF